MKNKNLKQYFEEFDNKFSTLEEIDRNFYEKEIGVIAFNSKGQAK